MALIKDGKIYRTLEEQVGYLTKKQGEQDEINEDVSSDITNLENTKADTTYVDNKLSLKTNKGEEIIIIEISSSSGTLSDDNYNKVLLNNSIIKYNVSTVSYYLNKIGETSSTVRFGAIQNDTTRVFILDITKSTKEYTVTNKPVKVLEDGVFVTPSGDIIGKVLTVNSSYESEWKDLPSVTSGDVDSETATSGQVLTANGSGGASWQNASGGAEYVTISSGTSGTLSSANLNILKNNRNAFIDYGAGHIMYKLYNESGTLLVYTAISVGDKWLKIEVNKTSGVWSQTSTSLNVASKVDSETATNGQVLTADGDGNASWQNSGGGLDIINITSSSGTFNATDLAKLGPEKNTIIVYTNGNFIYEFKYSSKNSTKYFYNNFTGGSFQQIQITISTGVYSFTDTVKYINNSNITSGSATSGQVLTADGSGGASWQNVSGGSSKYQHNIQISWRYGSGSPYTWCILNFNFISSDSTAINTLSTLKQVLYNLGYTTATSSVGLVCSGYLVDTSGTALGFAHNITITGNQNGLEIGYTDSSNNPNNTYSINTNPRVIIDLVQTL